MEKRFYKAIVLVLASDQTELLQKFKLIYESYMNENTDVKVFFTYGAGIKFERKEHDLVYDDLKETMMTPWMTTKVTRAMEYIDTHYDYDFLIRTNISTFWDFDALLKRLSTYPTEKFFTGRVGGSKDFITGTSMVISRDIIKSIVENQRLINVKYDYWVAEDKLISFYITKNMGVNFIPSRNTALMEGYKEYDETRILSDIVKFRLAGADNFRIKNYANEYENRLELDPKISNLLLNEIYKKTL
jgi:hypothetical protein